VPDNRRGQIFAVLGSLVQTFTLLGTLAAGPVTDAVGPRLTWGISAILLTVGYLNAVLVTALKARREARGAPVPEGVEGVALAGAANGHAGGPALERIASLLEEVHRTHEAEEARGFVTRSRRHHARGSRRRRRG
jgi:hypothetical protein